jgi:hypothetical protein
LDTSNLQNLTIGIDTSAAPITVEELGGLSHEVINIPFQEFRLSLPP